MEQEALRRVQEMHSGARFQKNPQTKNTPAPEIHPESRQNMSQEKPLEEQSLNKPDSPNLNSLFADKEKLLILLLIMVLGSEDNSDPALTLALLYLII